MGIHKTFPSCKPVFLASPECTIIDTIRGYSLRWILLFTRAFTWHLSPVLACHYLLVGLVQEPHGEHKKAGQAGQGQK